MVNGNHRLAGFTNTVVLAGERALRSRTES
jgi:hypothetical protein